MRLQRECQAIVAANRQAEEAAREMKAQAERESAAKQPDQPAPGPAAASDARREVPTR
jgi:hypothetical protein